VPAADRELFGMLAGKLDGDCRQRLSVPTRLGEPRQQARGVGSCFIPWNPIWAFRIA